MPRLHVIDGTYELFRAHFTKRPGHTAPWKQDVKATVGIVWSLLALLHEESEAVSHIAVAFDHPIRSFRNDLYAGYKTEDGVDPALLAQFDLAEEATRAIGVTVWSMDKWEADDALATAAARWAGDVEQVRIMTPDKDLGQAIRGRRVVQVDRMRKKEIDEDALVALRGVGPASIPDLLALMGDSADGFPGLPGFGEKTAAALLARFVHIEAIPGDAKLWPKGIRGADRLAPVLREMRDTALLYRRLATLVDDVPLGEALGDLEWKGVPRKEFTAWCDKLGVGDLRTRPARWA